MPAHKKSQPLARVLLSHELFVLTTWMNRSMFCTDCTEDCTYCKWSSTDILSLPYGWIYKQPFVLITWINLSTSFCTGYMDQHKWHSVLTTRMNLSTTFCTGYMDQHKWHSALTTWMNLSTFCTGYMDQHKWHSDSVLTIWMNLSTTFCTGYMDQHRWHSVLTTWMSLSMTFSTIVLFSSSSCSDSISLSISFRYQPIRSDLRRPASLSATATFLLQPLLFPS